jgi:hypothetical protein
VRRRARVAVRRSDRPAEAADQTDAEHGGTGHDRDEDPGEAT